MSRFYNYHIQNTVLFKSIKLLRNRIVIFVNDGSNAVLRKLGFNIEKEDAFKKSGTNIVYENYTYRLDV